MLSLRKHSYMLVKTKSKVGNLYPICVTVLTRSEDEDLIKFGLEEDVW